MRYRELIGKTVVDPDGARVGRLQDLIAERRDNRLCVTHIVVGPLGLSARIGIALGTPRRVPWQDITRIDRDVVVSGRAQDYQGREK